ncbi:TetR/AcrR family transcriptional regulator [Paenibacillus sp. Marseille-P2973]|uniref:TetR/AcrR family transcriptional regulator n=1 Tax=Paenibacillus sp. Marseille-P2973 TaxID=1871032 RepID=UPI001B38190E|nr:TetR/AcrR family transcriptional regulator [Paenibacillus sp. Marseille-P2973]MBQ4901210.1 TetR/AcrR family transcriptional regulator [Paenibacillus sp. Marseille-P2973]
MDKDSKKRKRILEYALQQFVTVGYSKVSTSQIASDLKMSKSTFYKYFTSKEELLFAVIDDFYNLFEQEVQSIINDDRVEITEKVQLFILSVRRRFSQLHVSVVEDLRRAVPEAYAHLEERRRSIITGTLIGMFEHGARDGFFRSDIPPVIIANVLIQAMQHLEHPEVIGRLEYNFVDMFHQVFSVIMEGSLSEEGRERFRS